LWTLEAKNGDSGELPEGGKPMMGIPGFTAKASLGSGESRFAGETLLRGAGGVEPAVCTTHQTSDGVATYTNQTCCYSDPIYGYLGCHHVLSVVYRIPGE
jgi:hypothetical protein